MNKTIKAIHLFKILPIALITITLLLGFSANTVADDRMYWVGGGDGDIKRSGLDGSNREIILDSTDTGGALAISLDQINGKMYWMTSVSVRRSNLDGSNIEILTTIPSGGISNFISLDVDGGKMYYGAFGRIRRANLDGSNAELLYEEAGISNIFGPALDPQAGKMYWAITQPGLQKIVRSNLDGSNIEELITSGLEWVNGIALDPTGDKLYWTSSSATRKVVSRANLDGTGVEDLVDDPSRSVAGVTLDVPAGKLYFIDPQFNTIFQANLDGSDLTSIQTGIGANALMLALELEIIPPNLITFIYDSTTNASAVGGSSTEPVTVTFTFDSGLSNGTGSVGTSPSNGSYGPWDGTLRVGNDSVVLTGGTIEVFNNASTDGYDFRWDSVRGTSTGTLFGETLDFFRVLIVDNDLDMLTSINLPSDPSFALKGDFIQDSYDLSNFSSFGLSEFSGPGRSFTLNSIIRVHDSNFDFLGIPQDGFNLTRDTKAKLEWLDLSLSTSRSVVEVLPQFGEGDDFEGFRHATRSEVDVLFNNAGIPDIDSSTSVKNVIPVSSLIKNYLGTTYKDTSNTFYTTQGYINEQSILGGYTFPFLSVRTDLGWATAPTGSSTSVMSATSNGHWLVRTTNPIVEIVGTVRTVDDFAGHLGNVVNVGDTITGTYTYDTTIADAQVDPKAGDYRYSSAPFGIKVNINGLKFKTDPNNVDFLLQIADNIGASPRDNYLLRSYNNIFDSTAPNLGPQGNHISWQLDDPTATALSSDSLLRVPPVLTDFQSIFGLTISSDGDYDSFLIRSDVTSAKLGDGDWISDEIDRTIDGSVFIDQRSFYSDHFSDQQLLSPQGDAGTTFGRILTRDGLIVQVTVSSNTE